jgi:hypothetical protein
MRMVGRLASSVIESGTDLMGLGCWYWIRIDGGSKNTCVVTAYHTTNPLRKMKGKTVWDQHIRYFKARGQICNPHDMFSANLISLLWQWKNAGDEIVLLGDFNKNIYTGNLARSLSGDNLRMHELCQRITGLLLPHTYIRGSVPIDAVFRTVGIDGVAIALLPSRIGIGNHRVFIVNVTSASMLGDVFSRVILATGWLLNCASDMIKNNYSRVLNQLTDWHLLFRKLLYINRDSNSITYAQV